MRGMFAIAAAVVGFGAIAALAADPNGRPGTDQPAPLTTRDYQLRFGTVGRGDHPTRRCRSSNEADAVSFSRPDAGHSATGHAWRRPFGQTKIAASECSPSSVDIRDRRGYARAGMQEEWRRRCRLAMLFLTLQIVRKP